MISQIALSAKINTLKKFVKSFLTVTACMSEETRRHLKLVGTRPGIMYGPCKVHAECVEGCLPFRQNLPTLQTPTYKLAKFLVPVSESLTTNKYTVKDLFIFVTVIVDQDSSSIMVSFDINSLFTNIHLK